MQELINIIVNNGIGVFCVIYICLYQSKNMEQINKNMEDNNKVLQSLIDEVKEVKEKVEK